MWQPLTDAVGTYKVIEYSQARIQNVLAQDTDYTVVAVTEPTRELPDLADCTFEKPGSLMHTGGKRFGRIAKASFKGNVVKSYEFIIQLGNAGGNFIEMSAEGGHAQAIFNCAVAILKSGKPVTVLYVEQVLNMMQDTNYVIYGFEAGDDL